MGERAEEIYARAQSAAGPDGRLALPPVGDWETFPFEGELRVRPLTPPLVGDRPRRGERGEARWRCDAGLEGAIWSDASWLVSALERPSGLPVVVILFPRSHYDLDDLPAPLATELGPMVVRVEAAVRAVGEVGRIHVCRWGDGTAHLHWWFMARPARMPQLAGSFAAIWDDILPPTPEAVWSSNLEVVARVLAGGGGTAHL